MPFADGFGAASTHAHPLRTNGSITASSFASMATSVATPAAIGLPRTTAAAASTAAVTTHRAVRPLNHNTAMFTA